MAMNSKLIIVGTPIGNLGDISPRVAEALRTADVILCEDTRHTLQLLNHLKIKGPRLVSLHEHNEVGRTTQVIEMLQTGQVVALVSDAGLPLVSDPGSRLVPAVIAAGYPVVAIDGPNAALHALLVSGMDTSRFAFEGFLPRSGKDRAERLQALAVKKRTAIIYESPQRLAQTIKDLAGTDQGSRRIAITRELTKLHEEVWRGTLAEATVYLSEIPPRGEYTLVLEGVAQQAIEVTDTEISKALATEIKAGATKRDAVRVVSEQLRVPRDRVYALANALK
jgi:16S rRNA (cytidine1402-2'-O)-methyltransferase